MNKSLDRLLRSLGFATSLGLLAMLASAPPAAAQNTTPPAPAAPAAPATPATQDAAKDAAKDQKEATKESAEASKDAAKESKDAKDAAKETKEAAKDSAKETKEATKDASKDASAAQRESARQAKDSAKETSEATKEAAKDARSSAKDSTRSARDAAKDTSKEADKAARDARSTTRDTSRDARSTARDPHSTTRDATRDPRSTSRDATRDARGTSRDARDARTTSRDRDADRDRDDRDVRRDSDRDRDARVSVDAHRSSSRHFDVNTFRSADMGLWLRSANNGLVISDISDSGPIARFGFHTGDRIVSVNGRRVSRERDFVQYLFADDVRTERVKVVVLRDGREEVIVVEPAVFLEEQEVAADPLEDFGLVIDDRYNDKLIVWKVIPRTPAFYAGFRAGDVITVFNSQPVRAPREFGTLVGRAGRDNVSVEVMRNNQRRTLDVEFAANGDRDVHRGVDVNRRSEPQRREVLRVDPDATTPAPAVTPAPTTAPTRTAPAPATQPSRSLLPRARAR